MYVNFLFHWIAAAWDTENGVNFTLKLMWITMFSTCTAYYIPKKANWNSSITASQLKVMLCNQEASFINVLLSTPIYAYLSWRSWWLGCSGCFLSWQRFRCRILSLGEGLRCKNENNAEASSCIDNGNLHICMSWLGLGNSDGFQVPASVTC